MIHFKSWAMLSVLTLAGAAMATDYSEEEPNNDFPPQFLTGNPVFQTGDRFVGSITSDDIDTTYLTFQGAGAAGLYRYTFNIDAGGGDTVMDIFDQTSSGFFLAANDDFPGLGLSSRLIFDHFDPNGANQVFGLDVMGFGSGDVFDYAVSWTRTAITPTNLGVLPAGATQSDYTSVAGGGVWYSFTLNTASTVTIDTLSTLDQELDSEFAVFNSAGDTIGGNDDADGTTLLSATTMALNAGTYFVSLGTFNSRYNWDLAGGAPLGWDRNGFSSDIIEEPFTLTITSQPVPEPATLAALGLGAVALLRKRRKV